MDEIITKIAKVPLAQRLLVAIASLVVIVLATYFFMVSPLEAKIAQQEAESEKLGNQLIQKKAIARDLTRYQVEVERLKQQLNEALELLPAKSEIPELLQKLASLVEQSDCHMIRFSPSKESSQGFYARIPVEMEVEGNYHSIAVFFDKVAKLGRIVNVNNIKLSSPKTENKRVILKAKFLATTFRFVEKKAEAAPAKKKK